MGTTYLFKDKTENGQKKLRVGSRQEFIEILRMSNRQPADKRRYFIREKSLDENQPDTLVIEVDRSTYNQWNKENGARLRNVRESKKYRIISMTSLNTDIYGKANNKPPEIREEMMYEDVITEILFLELREELRKWKPWALDMLNVYLSAGFEVGAAEFADRYQISKTTAWRYVRQFEQKVRNFLKG